MEKSAIFDFGDKFEDDIEMLLERGGDGLDSFSAEHEGIIQRLHE
jgi:hypothetical protein